MADVVSSFDFSLVRPAEIYGVWCLEDSRFAHHPPCERAEAEKKARELTRFTPLTYVAVRLDKPAAGCGEQQQQQQQPTLPPVTCEGRNPLHSIPTNVELCERQLTVDLESLEPFPLPPPRPIPISNPNGPRVCLATDEELIEAGL